MKKAARSASSWQRGAIVLLLGLLVGLLVFAFAGCKKLHRTDMKALDQAGMNFSSEEALRGMDITDAEVADLVKVKQAGVSDGACVELARIAHERHQPFNEGEAVAGLSNAGLKDEHILELARINQLGVGAGELQAIRLAGLSDATVLEVARRRAAGQITLSGPSLAAMKNAGLNEATILELIRRGANDEQAAVIVALKRGRASDADILRRFNSQ